MIPQKMTNKNLVLNLLEKDALNNGAGLTTAQIAEKVYMQRANVSRILNELVEEGYALKSQNTRPVVYSRSELDFDRHHSSAFEDVIGADCSLKQAVHLAKAAIMYPNKSLNVLIVAPSGSGKSMFARKMHQYAIDSQVLKADAPFVTLNCRNFYNEPETLCREFDHSLREAEDGLFYIDNCNYLDAESRSMLATLLNDGFLLAEGKRRNANTILVCSLSDTVGVDDASDVLRRKFSIVIELPSIENRSLGERFRLIEKFMCEEAKKSNCNIFLDSEVLIALLLYNCKNNIKQLQNDIRQACASAYARCIDVRNRQISLSIKDFPKYVYSGILIYKNRRKEVDALIGGEKSFFFDKNSASAAPSKENGKPSIYEWIKAKSQELYQMGLTEAEVNTIVNVGIENEFNKYRNTLGRNVVNKEQLSQLVDAPLVDLVEELLQRASRSLNRFYPTSVFYGLCLHMQALLDNKHSRSLTQVMKADNIIDFVRTNKEEYSLASDFSDQFRRQYGMELSISEIVVIAMFLRSQMDDDGERHSPAILIAMHGNGVAHALAEVVMALGDMTVYSYDLLLSKKPLDAYEDLKEVVLRAANPAGLIAICDMGSLQDILNMIAIETGIAIKTIELPITGFLLDCCRQVMMCDTAEEACRAITEHYSQVHLVAPGSPSSTRRARAVISICLTGQGSAVQIKRYLEKNYRLGDVEVIPLQLKAQKEFVYELNRISKEKEILCIVGTFDPHIYGIPFIPIENIFSQKNEELDTLLQQNSLESQEFLRDAELIFGQLKNELHQIDAVALQPKLTDLILNVEAESGIPIGINEKIGLLVHMACAIDRLKGGAESPRTADAASIIAKNIPLYRVIQKNLVEIEKDFGVSLNDDELANIICTIRKSKNG